MLDSKFLSGFPWGTKALSVDLWPISEETKGPQLVFHQKFLKVGNCVMMLSLWAIILYEA